MKPTAFLLGLTSGLLGAATTVLLTTPKSGKELRSSLKTTKNNANNQIQDLKQKMTIVKNSINNIKSEVKETIPKFVEEAKVSVVNWQEETAPIQQQLQQEIEALQNSVDEIQQQVNAFQNRKVKSE